MVVLLSLTILYFLTKTGIYKRKLIEKQTEMNKKLYPYIVVITAILFYIPFLGSVHLFDWDEINFAESAREMIVTGNFSRVQIDFHPFWEKPPLFFWMQALRKGRWWTPHGAQPRCWCSGRALAGVC